MIKLPPERLNFFLSDRYKASLDRIKEGFRLSQEDANFVSDLDRLVMADQMDLEAYLVALEDELKMDPKMLTKLQAELLAERFLPFNDDLSPSADEVARKHGLDMPKTEYYRVYRRPLTYSGAASEVAEMAGISLLGQRVRNRLRDVIIKKTKEGIVDTQVLEVMTRGEEFGGLGFEPRTASRALAAVNDILERAEVLTEEKYTDWLADQTSGAGAAKDRRGEGPETEEEENKAKTSEEIKDELTRRKREADTVLGRAVDATLGRLPYHAPTPHLDKRLRNAVSSRLRSVRSAAELRELLTRPDKVGGLGLAKDVATNIADAVEAAYAEFRDVITGEEKQKLNEQVVKQKTVVEGRRRKEAEEHAQWFEEKMREAKTGPGSPFAPPSPGAARPAVDAVRHERPRLVGLAGELASLTREDFRRMGASPEDARAAILKKINTLSAESYDQRIRAIESLRRSPLNMEYLELMSQSLREGKPVAELAKTLRAEGKDALTAEEIAAIIQLNSALHY